MPYEDDYKMWLEKMLIRMNPDWICDGMHDTEFTNDWCDKHCGKDDLYITPKCLHMYYHHIARADHKDEPQTEVYKCPKCGKDTPIEFDECVWCLSPKDEPLTKCDLCKREDDDICVDCERKKQSGKE